MLITHHLIPSHHTLTCNVFMHFTATLSHLLHFVHTASRNIKIQKSNLLQHSF